MSIFSIIHEIPVGARFPISQDQISRIQEEALAIEARINTDTCLVCGHTSVTDIESPCPVCELAKANKRIAELEAENARLLTAVVSAMFDVKPSAVTQQARDAAVEQLDRALEAWEILRPLNDEGGDEE